jgi:microcystin-dependent protein
MFKSIHTAYGLAAMAQAEATGTPINLTHMAVGDGNGAPVEPSELQTQLVRERYRAAINRVYQSPGDPTRFTAEMIVPNSVGGFVMREVGVFDSEGGLFAVGNLPESYKPTVNDGAFGDTVIRLEFVVTNADVVNVVVDGNVAVATHTWVLNNVTVCTLLPGGTTGQILRKKSNACGDTEWADLGEFDVVVDLIEERQTLIAGQTAILWNEVTTNGLSVYVEGVRIPKGSGPDEWSEDPANPGTGIILGKEYPAGTRVVGVQNEPMGSLQIPLYRDNNLSDVPNKQTARDNLDVFNRAQTREMAPPGLVAFFARNTAPSGWLKANGAAVSRTAYADLFAAIGTTFGAGDGVNTFNLPDLRGEFVRGWDNGRGVDAGRAFGSWQKGTLVAVDHDNTAVAVNNVRGTPQLAGCDTYDASQYSGMRGTWVKTDLVFTMASSPNEFGAVRPRNRALLACIKY